MKSISKQLTYKGLIFLSIRNTPNVFIIVIKSLSNKNQKRACNFDRDPSIQEGLEGREGKRRMIKLKFPKIKEQQKELKVPSMVYHKSEFILGYKVSSRSTWATCQDTVSLRKTRHKNKTKSVKGFEILIVPHFRCKP